MSNTKILALAAAALFIIAVAAALFQLRDAGDREVVNRYNGSEFSFTYPLGYDIEEYPNGSIAIGTTTPDGFAAVVELTVAEAQTSEYPDYESFVAAQLSALCAADGPGESISCEPPFERVPVKNAQGENAGQYALTLTHVRATETVTHPYGPIYSYVLTSADDSEEFRFMTLIVRHPLPAAVAGTVDAALLARINDSIVIGSSR